MNMLYLGIFLLACFTVSLQFPASLLEHDDDEESRVFGGMFAKPGEFPWMVNLYITSPDGTHATCGGSIISKNHVLTAAHCLCENATTQLFVNVEGIVGRIGNVTRAYAKQVTFNNMTVHKHYNAVHNNDIAILKLTKPIEKFDENVRNICIPKKSMKNRKDGKPAVVQMGWGSYDNVSLGVTRELRTTFLGEILDETTCNNVLKEQETSQEEYGNVGPGKICISNVKGEKICEGDSGGPLCIIEGTEKLAIGIVSFDYYSWCVAGNTLPTFYTDIGHYAQWITLNTIGDDDICWIK